LRRKQLWMVIAALIMLNCLTIAFFLSKTTEASSTSVSNEAVASIGKKTISRQEWLDELVNRYGKDVLKDMIDQKVVNEMAAKYKIHVSDKDVDREFRMLQTNYQAPSDRKNQDDRKLKEQIKSSLLLQEILTKDVVISDRELKQYYNRNKGLFDVPDAYHLSQIIVKTKDEAKKAIKELSQGSSFSALAMERSIEEFSANDGGDIGYISQEDERYPKEYLLTAKKLKKGAYSQPIKVEQGYAILKLNGKINGIEYSFADVKEQIRRQMALEQMKIPASARSFWDEAKVKWFYGSKNED
jgi:foldase protein PrsA